MRLQSDLFFNSAVHFSYIRRITNSLLLRLLRLALLNHLFPRTTFVKEEASRDIELRTTERRAWNTTLVFNSTFILYRVFSTLCARSLLRRHSTILKQKKKHFFEKLYSDERLCLYKPNNNNVPIPEKSDNIVLKVHFNSFGNMHVVG